jgi:membrane protease YdiL (CAAX protease family)
MGALDVWVGIVTGVALGLSPVLSGAVSIASAVVGVTLVVVAGGRLQRLIYRSRRLAKRRERVERVWKRYGIPGVALQAPLLTGPLLATVFPGPRGSPAPPPVLDDRQRGVLGSSSYRSRGFGALDIPRLVLRVSLRSGSDETNASGNMSRS